MIDSDECSEIRNVIADIQRRHREELKPYIDRLIQIESCLSPRPVYINVERAKELGLLVDVKPFDRLVSGKCMACGGNHPGQGSLPCPNMTPMAVDGKDG